MKSYLIIIFVMFSNLMFAQLDLSEIAKLFQTNEAGDINLKSNDNTTLKIDYYIKDGILYREGKGELKSIALNNIDFAKEFIYENAIDEVVNSKKSPFDLTISSLKPKKTPGFSLTFEYEKDAQLAFKFLKMKAENPSDELKLTTNFSSQMIALICSTETDFKDLKGELIDKTRSAAIMSNIQLEGALVTKIYGSTLEIDFGIFDTDLSANLAFEKLVQNMFNVKPNCSSLKLITPKPKTEIAKNEMLIWSTMQFSNQSSAQITVKKMSRSIKINIGITYPSTGEEDDDFGW